MWNHWNDKKEKVEYVCKNMLEKGIDLPVLVKYSADGQMTVTKTMSYTEFRESVAATRHMAADYTLVDIDWRA